MSLPPIAERIRRLCETKMKQTKEKQQVIGYMDYDDHGMILPPAKIRRAIQTVSGSGMPITDVVFSTFVPAPTHANGGFYGSIGQGMNFRVFLQAHPPYIDPMCALAGAYMANFNSYRKAANPDLSYDELHELQNKYQLTTGIFAMQHFCQDLQIGLDLGWDGIREKIAHFKAINTAEHNEFYDALDMTAEGIQCFIENNARLAKEMSKAEPDAETSAHLAHLYEMNMKLAHKKPDTFEEACQFILWMQLACQTYNGSGSLGRLDVLLLPYYLRDTQACTLTSEQAVFIMACLLLRETAYVQLGGYDELGNDTTNPVSYLILEAVHLLKLPSNVGVCVGHGIDRGLLRRSVELQFEDKNGNPRFVGMDSLVKGLVRNPGVTLEMARMRTNSGCHWMAIPGREYSIMDCVKINLAHILDISVHDTAADEMHEPAMEQIIAQLKRHLEIAVDTLAEGFTFTYENQIHNCPELPLDLMCHGTIERGLDASNGGVDHYLWCVDGAGLAVAADSLAAINRRVFLEKRFSLKELVSYLDADWQGEKASMARVLMLNTDRFGKGGSEGDKYAALISQLFTRAVTDTKTPKYGHSLVPGLFSWANTISMGKTLGATPNGRMAGQPISHGANPNPGFRHDGAATALSLAIADVQPGYGNTAPMQIEIEPSITAEEGGIDLIMALIEDHFEHGGTLINLNVIDADRIRRANDDPSLFPDLIVRVTGFSAFFASLSPGFRQLVVDRILDRQTA